MLSKADVWVNGTRIATKDEVNGAYTRHDLDITAQVHDGANSVAFKVYPNDPTKDLSMARSTTRPRTPRSPKARSSRTTWASPGPGSSTTTT